MIWKLLPQISAPMPFQMALDELLFEMQIQESLLPVLRFYSTSDPWISAGYSFRQANDLNTSSLVLENPKIPICRRVTGGGCVLHGKDLIFSLIARYDHESGPLNSVRTSYGMLHEGVKIALKNFGLELEFYSSQRALPKGKDCFRYPVASDLAWKGHKIAGGAQKRSRGVLLHQESIQKPKCVERDALGRAVCEGLAAVMGITIRTEDLDPELLFQAERKASTQAKRETWKNSEVI